MPSINSAQVSLLPELLLQALGYSDAQVRSTKASNSNRQQWSHGWCLSPQYHFTELALDFELSQKVSLR